MGNRDRVLCRLGTALVLLALAACGPRPGGPAPVVLAVPPAGYYAASAPPPDAPGRMRVERGQSLSMIAARHHVSEQALIAANRLRPPYRLEAGRTLVIPSSPSYAAAPPPGRFAAAPRPTRPPPPSAIAALPAVPARPAPTLTPPPRPVATAQATRPEPGPMAEVQADVATAEAEEAARHRPQTTKSATSREEPVGASLSPPPAAPAAKDDARFRWPVRGRILAGFGPGTDGTHNDGINIAAPKGAPVEAADAGVVAYAGNELRGYGNLILVKHPHGWISAYAHCDVLLVRKGQKVARGQVIARVGATGSVAEPQLHFELRRDSKPVDPRDYLGPLPTAAAGEHEGSG